MNYVNYSDQELIKEYREGNKLCMEILIQRYKKQVYSYILVKVKDKTLADDLFQDTFIKVIQSIKNNAYVDNNKFIAWVIRIAHNIIMDFYRHNKKQAFTTDSEMKINLYNSEKWIEETIENKFVIDQINADLHKLIEHLPAEQKEIVYLRFYGDMSFKEIAETANISINTALGRMRYALINIRKIIEEKNIVLIS